MVFVVFVNGPVCIRFGDSRQEVSCKQCGAIPVDNNLKVIEMKKAIWPASEVKFPGQNPYFHRYEPTQGYKELDTIQPFGYEAIHPIGLEDGYGYLISDTAPIFVDPNILN